MSHLKVSDLLERRSESLGLTLLTGEPGLTSEITSADISSPGLVLAGFTERIPQKPKQPNRR